MRSGSCISNYYDIIGVDIVNLIYGMYWLYSCCYGNYYSFIIVKSSVTYSPYYGVHYLTWYVHWVWKFNIKKCCYGDEEKAYLTRKKLKLTVNQWEVSNVDLFT